MAGGLAVISDVPKTLVYRLARAVNARSADGRPSDPRIDADQAALGRAAPRPDRPGQPAALRPAGRDPGGAPGRGAGRPALVARGFAAAVVEDVLRRVRTSEYKRRQMPPGLKITGKAFGPGPALSRSRAAPDRALRGRQSGFALRGLARPAILACMVRGPPRGGHSKHMRAAITVLPGDGIGPEVVAQATRVLAAVGERWGHTFSLREALIGGAAIDETGTALPPETLAVAREADAVLLGAVGGPKWDDPQAKVRPEQGLLAHPQGAGPVRQPAPGEGESASCCTPRRCARSCWPASTCSSCAS